MKRKQYSIAFYTLIKLYCESRQRTKWTHNTTENKAKQNNAQRSIRLFRIQMEKRERYAQPHWEDLQNVTAKFMHCSSIWNEALVHPNEWNRMHFELDWIFGISAVRLLLFGCRCCLSPVMFHLDLLPFQRNVSNVSIYWKVSACIAVRWRAHLQTPPHAKCHAVLWFPLHAEH